MDKPSSKYQIIFVYTALALITLAVFQQVHRYEFVNYDDDYISETPQVQAGLTAEGIRWAFTTSYGENWYPLTWLSHMLDSELFGLDPGRYHLVNLVFHIINTLLLFAVFKAMTGRLWSSGFIAALFALHPLHVESVAWISERKDVLSTLFWLLTMAVYLRYVKHRHISWYLLMLLVFTLGLLTKPMLVTLPFVLLLLDWWPLGRFETGRRVLPRLVLEKIPLFIISAVSSVITLIVEGKGAGSSLDMISLKMRIANIPIAYMTYIIKTVWPSRLAVLYPHPGEGLSMQQAAIATLVLVGISALVIRLAAKHKYLPVGWLWFLGTLVPVIGLVQVGSQAWADRYSYVPLTGLFVIIAWGVNELLSRLKYRRIILAAFAIVVISVLSVCSWFQTRYWQDSETICRRALKVTTDNYIMHNNLGYALQSQGKLDEATGHYYKALEINPDFVETYNNLGIVYQTKGKFEEAIDYYRRALELVPEHAKTNYNLGNVLHLQGKFDEAIVHYRKALETRPDDAKAHSNLGIALAAKGKLDEAIEHYHQGLKAAPDNANIYYNLGTALTSQGKLDEAINYYRRALQIKPDDAEVHNSLGLALAGEGKLDEAVKHYRKALEIDCDYLAPMGGLAWILATHPDPGMRDTKSAIEYAERAAELTEYRDGFVLNTLAAAYAAAGRNDKAISTAQKALELAVSEKDEELANHIRGLLELYKGTKP